MTDEELYDIGHRWEGVGKGYQNMKFEEAHADMLALLTEVRALRQSVPRLEAQARDAELRFRNMQGQFLSDVEALVRKHSWGGP